MEDTNQQQPTEKRESRWKLNPECFNMKRKIVWDEAAKKKFAELPYKSDLDFEIDTLQICLEVRGKA